MIIFVPGRSQLIIFRVFRANQLCKTCDLELRSSVIWCFFARALGTISVTLTTILDDHFYFHPAVKTLAWFFPFPFSSAHFIFFPLRSLITGPRFEIATTKVTRTSLKVWREKSRTPSKALIKVASKARRAENQVSGKS